MNFLIAANQSRFLGSILLALRALLAAFFVMLAVKSLSGDAKVVEDFRRFGYSDGFRTFVGILQLLGALLLLPLRTLPAGAVILAFVLLGATWSHFKHDAPATLITPLACLALLGVVFGLQA